MGYFLGRLIVTVRTPTVIVYCLAIDSSFTFYVPFHPLYNFTGDTPKILKASILLLISHNLGPYITKICEENAL